MKAMFMMGLIAITLAFAGCCKKVSVLEGTCPPDGCCDCPSKCHCPNGICNCPDCKNCGHCKK